MPTATEMATKSTKVRNAMQQEAARLRHGDRHDNIVADKLVKLSHEADNNTLSRLFDLLVTYPTKAAALASLEGRALPLPATNPVAGIHPPNTHG